MKQLILLLTFSFLVNTTFAQQQLTQNFSAKGNTGINVGIKNNKFSVEQWKQEKFSIVIEIKVNYPKTVIDQLVKVERYKVEASLAGSNLNLQTPSLNKVVTIGGKALNEDIKITVKTPPSYANNTNGTSISKSKDMRSIQEPIDVVINFVYPEPAASVGNPSNMGAINDGRTSVEPSDRKGVQAKYGDIIIGTMSLDNFYD